MLRLRCSTREAEAVSWSATRLRRSPVVTVVWLSSLASRMVGNCPGRWLYWTVGSTELTVFRVSPEFQRLTVYVYIQVKLKC